MKIAEFVTADLPYPYPDTEVFAPLDTTAVLVEGLVSHNFDVTWYAAAGTKSAATVRTFDIEPVRFTKDWTTFPQTKKDHLSVLYSAAFLSHLAEECEQYDVIHLHTFYLALAFARLMPHKPILITLHNPLTSVHVQANLDLHRDLKNIHYISISNSQRRGRPDLNYAATIYHGLNIADLTWSPTCSDRWIFVGRIVPDKGAHVAVQLAKKAGINLDLVGPNYLEDPANADYFKTEIEPHVDGEKIRYLGAKSHGEVARLFADAKGHLFPLQWEEPFGLTVIEALAAGTPTVTFNRGSMPEIIENGKTGFVVEDEDAMVEAIKKIETIDRRHCREVAEKRFSAERVLADHIRVFSDLAR